MFEDIWDSYEQLIEKQPWCMDFSTFNAQPEKLSCTAWYTSRVGLLILPPGAFTISSWKMQDIVGGFGKISVYTREVLDVFFQDCGRLSQVLSTTCCTLRSFRITYGSLRAHDGFGTQLKPRQRTSLLIW